MTTPEELRQLVKAAPNRVVLECITLPGGQKVYAHPSDLCAAHPCCIHNPSDHRMRDWPLVWRADRAMMERTCPHGIGHPDPDHMAYVLQFPGQVGERESGVHGCDGCCHTRGNADELQSSA